jgi:hypothetical protein
MTVRESALAPLTDRITPLLKSLALYGIEMSVFLIFFAVYFLLRGIAPDRPALATDNAMWIVDLERGLGVFWEPAWQRQALGSTTAIDLGNFVYLNMHLPFLAVFGFFIFHAQRRKHRVIRNTLIISMFLGVPFYHLIPVTPPRLLAENGIDLGFVDTIVAHQRPRPGPLTNWYAAIPSFHYGWNLVLVIGVWWVWKSPWIRGAAVAFSALMWWSIVVTANHYFLDMAFGAALCLLAFWLALRWERWHDTHERASRKFLYCDDVRLPF